MNEVKKELSEQQLREQLREQQALVYEFVHNVERKQNRTWKWLIPSVGFSIVFGVVLLIMLTIQVRNKLQQAEKAEIRLINAQTVLDNTQKELKGTRDALREAINLGRYTIEVNFTDIKLLYQKDPDAAALLNRILDNEKIPWKLDGKSKEEGFDSPGFAAYILNRSDINLSRINVREQLLEKLPPKPLYKPPKSGDLIFYKSGYTMFYFIDEEPRNPKEFVIGMTPGGVVALRRDFAPFDEATVRATLPEM